MAGSVAVDTSSATIALRRKSGDAESRAADRVSESELFDADPWRTFRWYNGQRHYSGSYWAVTKNSHLIYESRLELSSLLMADFDPEVLDIASQPFLLTAVVNGHVRRHVPDFLWRNITGLVVVDVVRQQRLTEDPKIQMLCAWTREVMEALGWEYRVVSEQPVSLLGNVRFLAGYRRERYICADALQCLRSRQKELIGLRLSDAERLAGRSGQTPVTRSALLHMLWNQELWVDLDQPLRSSSVLGFQR